MNIISTNLKGVYVIKKDVYKDQRGYFSETFNEKEFTEKIGHYDFVQDNQSCSSKGVVRGLHFQKKNPQGKLVRCTKGRVFDIVVDIDRNSQTFSKSFSIELSSMNKLQLWIPPGYAHGFCALTDKAEFQYKCTEYFYKDDQYGIIWNDKDLDIDWPIKTPIVSLKDSNLPSLKKFISI